VIAGYDILNEPITGDVRQLNRFYHAAIEAIREEDPYHILFIEGVRYSTQFDALDFPFDRNVVYSAHFYADAGMGVVEYPGTSPVGDQPYNRDTLVREYARRTAYMRERNVPNWLGEFSITFTPRVSLESRRRYLNDMLDIVETAGDPSGHSACTKILARRGSFMFAKILRGRPGRCGQIAASYSLASG
jgi:hypothetical protein